MTRVSTSAGAPSSADAWRQRHTQIVELSAKEAVKQAHDEALHAANHIQQTDENAASVFAANARSADLVNDGVDAGESLGRKLDISLAILWSIPLQRRRWQRDESQASGSKHTRRHDGDKDCNVTRQRALAQLQQLADAALSEASRDLAPVRCLESSREGTVELVRCAFDRRIYVLKSTTKGAAKRNFRTNAPMTERRLLTLARQTKLGISAFTPACVASFQSPGSLHILMEYCPAGDLYHFLDSAGQAPVTNEARSKSGGLLVEEYVRKYATDMVAAISWLHAQQYMHRDLKPGNWLFDQSGHLMLCDLASAAPFAAFNEVPASASLPQECGSASPQLQQRRVLYRHCCLIGTADYIAPEVFWAADLMSRRQMQRREMSTPSASQAIDTLDDGDGSEDGQDDEPPPEGPGLYGPECDWWSLGVIIFEMVYKRMPFFSDSIAETMEMIKDHTSHLSLDPWVRCSANLKDLITHLMTRAEGRLGFQSSREVQAHPFFSHVDWSRPWRDSPPFVPTLSNAMEDGHFRAEMEPSVLHSPLPDQQSRSFCGNSFAASRLWEADAADFPAFPNSVELSRAVLLQSDDTNADDHNEGGNGSQPSQAQNDMTLGRDAERAIESQWADFDPTWIGFTRVPGPDAFIEPSTDASTVLTTAVSPNLQRPEDRLDSNIRLKKAESLHRKVLETSSMMNARDRFKTPLRKTSYSSLNQSDMVPPTSPYPFPIATSAQPRRPSTYGSGLRRKDLERARSVSTSTGEGSDSRCSGGSNAKRDISEREAWNELKMAVLQSARKSRSHPLRSSLDFSRGEHSMNTDADDENEMLHAQWLPGSSSHKKVSFEVKPAKRPASKADARHSLLRGGGLHKAAATAVQDTPQHSLQRRAMPSSSQSSPVPGSDAGEDELIDPTDNISSRTALSKRESARQLLLRAQHRETPTRTARPASPSVQGSALAQSAGVVKSSAEEHRGFDVVTDGSSPVGRRSAVFQRHFLKDNKRESTPQVSRTVRDPDRSASQLARHSILANLKRQGTLKRRDSRETLSQYRLGINPDDFVDLGSADNRRRSGTRSLERQTSNSRLDIMRGNSSLGLAREHSVRSPSIPSVPDAFLGPASIASCESSTSTSDVAILASQSADAALQKAAPARRAVRPIENITARQTTKSAEEAAASHRPSKPETSKRVEARSAAATIQRQAGDGRPSGAPNANHAAAKALPPPRPSLLKRASSYLRSLAPDSKRDSPEARSNQSRSSPSHSSPLRRRPEYDIDAKPKRASSPLRPAAKSAAAPQEAQDYAQAATATTSVSQSSLVVTRLHARYDHLQADIADLERRLSTVRSMLASSAV